MPTDKQTIEWYNQHAGDYTRHVRNPDKSVYHSLYEKPAMYKLLPDLHGKTILSIGCGSGEDCQLIGLRLSLTLMRYHLEATIPDETGLIAELAACEKRLG